MCRRSNTRYKVPFFAILPSGSSADLAVLRALLKLRPFDLDVNPFFDVYKLGCGWPCPCLQTQAGPVAFALLCPLVRRDFHLCFSHAVLMLLWPIPTKGGKSPRPSLHCPEEVWLVFQVWLGQAILHDSRTQLPCHPRWDGNMGWRRPAPFVGIHLISKMRRKKIEPEMIVQQDPLCPSVLQPAQLPPLATLGYNRLSWEDFAISPVLECSRSWSR